MKMLKSTIRWSSETIVGELLERLEHQRVIANPQKEQHRLARLPRAPRDRPPTKEYTGRNACLTEMRGEALGPVEV
jgi:hypothetical protein